MKDSDVHMLRKDEEPTAGYLSNSELSSGDRMNHSSRTRNSLQAVEVIVTHLASYRRTTICSSSLDSYAQTTLLDASCLCSRGGCDLALSDRRLYLPAGVHISPEDIIRDLRLPLESTAQNVRYQNSQGEFIETHVLEVLDKVLQYLYALRFQLPSEQTACAVFL